MHGELRVTVSHGAAATTDALLAHPGDLWRTAVAPGIARALASALPLLERLELGRVSGVAACPVHGQHAHARAV